MPATLLEAHQLENSTVRKAGIRLVSLRQMILLLILAFAASLVGFASYSVNQAEKLLLGQEWNELDATADNYKRHIQTLLDGYDREAALIASRTRLRQLARQQQVQPSAAARQGMARILRDARATNADIDSVSVLDAGGRVQAQAAGPLADGDIDAAFAAHIETSPGAAARGFWLTEIEADRIVVLIYSPMLLDGQRIGVLRTAVHPSSVLRAIRRIDIHHAGEITLGMVDKDGHLRLITGSTERTVIPREDAFRPEDLSIPMKMALNGRQNRLDGLVLERGSERVITVTRHLERVGWGLVARLDRAPTFAAIKPLYSNFLLLAALIIAVMLLSASLISRRLTAANRSVTEQLEAARQSERRFRSIFDAAPSGMLIVRADGCVDMANDNAETTLGYEPGDLDNRVVEELIPAHLRDLHHINRNRYARDPIQREMGRGRDLMALRKDGSHVPVEIGLTPLATDRGQMVIASITDRSEAHAARTAMESHAAALQRSNDELDQFAYVASHDLRAPLRGISQLVDFIEEDAGQQLDEDSCHHLNLIRKRTRRLDELLSNLLQYSRIGRVESEFASIDTALAVTSAAELYLADGKFELQIDGELPQIQAPPALLDMVLRNLFMNSVKHHDRDCGGVRVHAEEDDEFQYLVVEDDGPGIPPEYHEKVFQMFQTLKRRDEVEGSGMGLALVQKAMHYCQGLVTLDASTGRGSIFRLGFPKTRS